ncbi:MAG: AMP-binding protein [Betaproteobacteria bacterium]|nr:AMP-binding protein [Betaproteobacteria bacterium]
MFVCSIFRSDLRPIDRSAYSRQHPASGDFNRSRASVALGEIDILGDRQQAILSVWNPPLPSYDQNQTADKLFDKQAAASGEQVALAWSDGQMTYRELGSPVRPSSEALLENGVSKGCVVGVALERSADTIAVLLGILKIGAAYPPLDLRIHKSDFHSCLVIRQRHL